MWILAKKRMIHKSGLAILTMIGVLLFNLSNTKIAISGAWNCAMLPFFLFGVISWKYFGNLNIRGEKYVLLYFIVVVVVNIFIDNTISFYRTYLMLPLVGLLCIIGLLPVMHAGRFNCVLLEFWGRNSLPIYLWHVIPVLVLKRVWSGALVIYYIASLILLIIFVVISYYLNNKSSYDNSIYTSERR